MSAPESPERQAERLWMAAWDAAKEAASPEEVERIETQLRKDLAAIGQAHRYAD